MPLDDPHPLVSVYQSASRRACAERGLVLQAASIEYDIMAAEAEFAVVVRPADAALAREELEAYERETRAWLIPPPPPLMQAASGWVGVVVYAAVLVIVELFAERRAFSYEWLAAGRLNAGLVCQGEWYRTLTALTLHADAAHLLGNIVFGSLFGLFAGRLLGSGTAWIGIVTAGAAGNLVNACVQPPDHTSIGASTAVFAGLGMMPAYAWSLRRRTSGDWASRWAPLVGGVLLLAYTGAGGQRTDVIGHLTGFACGLLLGVLYGAAGDHIVVRRGAQFSLGAVTIAALAAAWWSALRAQG